MFVRLEMKHWKTDDWFKVVASHVKLSLIWLPL